MPVIVPPWHRNRLVRLRGPRFMRELRTSAALGTVTFPTTLLVSRAQIALGADLSADPLTWPWADITPWVRHDLGVSLTTGRRDEASQVTTGSATLKLDNRDGRFTRRNPNSPYYGLLSKNTPIWATVDAGSGEKTRLEMFINEWPTRWSDKSANDSTVTIRCAGILRRLQQGQVLKSALRRVYLSTAQPTLAAYWPGEDTEGAVAAASGLPGGSPLTPETGITAHFISGTIAGSDGAIDMTLSNADVGGFNRGLTANVAVSSSGFQIEATFATDAPVVTTGGLLFYICGTAAGPLGFSPTLADSEPHHKAYRFVQSGADVTVSSYTDGVLSSTTTLTSTTLGTTLELFTFPYNFDTSSLITSGLFSLSHLAVYDFSALSTPETRALAVDAYAGEMAHDRVERLCGEEGIPVLVTAAESEEMGPQSTETLVNLLRECEAADLGALYEKRWGLAYKSRREFYNQPIGLSLDFDNADIADLPEPADDDQRTRNLWKVSRVDGSERTFEQTTGEMGTGTEGPGIYDDAVSLNLETDDQLADQASWRVHLGTIDEDRWPSIGVNFARRPTHIDSWAALPFGGRITVANPLSQMPPDDLDLIVEGYSEFWNQFLWTASLNCSPASAYAVAIVSDPATIQEVPRVGSTTATLAAAISTSDTSLSVTTGTDGLWTTAAADFPLDINLGGERIRLSAISGASSPQTFTVSARSINGITKAHSAGASVTPWKTARVGL